VIQPRNHLVVVKLIEQAQKQVGKIVIPTNAEKYTEAEVVAVGPGTVAAEGGRPETHDLKPGQRVLVRHKEDRVGPAGQYLELAGIPYRVDDQTYHVFPQERIVGIIAQPGESIEQKKEDISQLLHGRLN
jgi:co-chaperonin GroES (HSP10)